MTPHGDAAVRERFIQYPQPRRLLCSPRLGLKLEPNSCLGEL